MVRECKSTGGRGLPREHADGCVKLAKDGGRAGWRGRWGGQHVAFFGTPRASGTGGTAEKTTTALATLITGHGPASSPLYLAYLATQDPEETMGP